MTLFFFQKKWKEVRNWFKGAFFQSTRLSLSLKKEGEQPLCQMLCIDDDKSFCIFIRKLATSFGIHVDIVHSIRAAKEAIEAKSEYKSFIIDGHLSDGTGFQLVAWMREKKEINLPIVFISRIYQDAASFRLLRERFNVDFVLEKPIQPAEIHQLFIYLSHLISLHPPRGESFPEAFLIGLKISYQKTISDKIERLEKMIVNAQRNSNIENLQKLKEEVHKISGSAGSYGYDTVSELCKNLELDLFKHIGLIKQKKGSLICLEFLDDFFTQIKLHFQIKIPQIEFQSTPKTGFLPSVFIVDEDKQFLQDFTQAIQHLDVEIVTESHPDDAIRTLASADFYPEIVLFNIHYHSSSLTGYDLIKAFYHNNDELTHVIALVVEAELLESQVEALKKGILVTIAKPFSPSVLLSFLEQISFRPFPLTIKIFIVEQDPDICEFILDALKYKCLDIRVVQDLSHLENEIHGQKPDLILLDINFADESGLDILRRLRKDWGYENLLVGMLTLTQQETHLLQQCYDSNVNDLLFKPLERGVLQRKIALLLKKKIEEKLSVKPQSKMKLTDKQTFKHYLNEFENQSQISPYFPKMLVVFEIEGSSIGSSTIKKQVVEVVSEALEDLLKKNEIAAHLKEERFALIFQGYDPHFVQLFICDFLQSIHAYLKKNLLMDPFSINEVLILLSETENAAHSLRRSDELLQLSRQLPRDSVNLTMDPLFIGMKELFVFHDDGQPLDFIVNVFIERGFKVRVNANFEELPQLGITLPLFILAGKFAELKGVSLVKKLMSQNHIQIPILHLPYLPDRDYLRRLLNEVHYFDSPFALIIILSRLTH